MSNTRKTNNSQKAASLAPAEIKEALTTKSPPLNQGFCASNTPKTTKTMASMNEIIQGKFLDEAFENMSTDEKLSMILSEIYKMRDTINTVQRTNSTLKQQVDTHEEALRKEATADNGLIDEMRSDITDNANSVIDINNEQYQLRERISNLETSATTHSHNLALLKGLSERQHKQIATNQKKITDLTTRSMDHNFTITSLPETRDENCKMIVIDFLQTKLGLQFEQDHILVAHRMGQRSRDVRRPRLMVIKVITKLKEQILANSSKLKGKTNDQGQSYYINLQLPDAVNAQKRSIQYEISRIKDFNESLPAGYKKREYNIKNQALFIDGKLHEQQVIPPTPLDIFVTKQDQKLMDEIDFTISKPKRFNTP